MGQRFLLTVAKAPTLLLKRKPLISHFFNAFLKENELSLGSLIHCLEQRAEYTPSCKGWLFHLCIAKGI